GTRIAVFSISSVTPRGAIISKDGGWKLPARRSTVSPGSASRTRTGTSRRARASAVSGPPGPAPATMTVRRVGAVMRPVLGDPSPAGHQVRAIRCGPSGVARPQDPGCRHHRPELAGGDLPGQVLHPAVRRQDDLLRLD